MKHLKSLVILVLVVLLSSPLVAAEPIVELGYKADWQLSDQTQFDLSLGTYYLSSGDDSYQPFGQVRLMHIMNEKKSLQMFLDGEITEEQLYMLAGYKTPFTEQAELSAGVGFETNVQNPDPQFVIAIDSNWNTGSGILNFQTKVGDIEELLSAHYYYPLEKRLTEKISVGGQVGVQYQWQSTQSTWSLPVLLSGTYHFNETFRMKLQAKDTYSYMAGDKGSDEENALTLGLYLESSFDTTIRKRELQVVDKEGVKQQVTQNSLSGSPASNEKASNKEIQVLVVEPTTQSQEVQQNEEPDEPVSEETQLANENFYDPSHETLCYNDQLVKVNSLNGNGMYLSIRDVIESLGGCVYWLDSDQQICIVLDDTRVFLNIQTATYLQNGMTFSLKEIILAKGHYYVQHADLMKILEQKI